MIEATVQNGRIEVPAPANLPDGTRVAVEISQLPGVRVGIDESEWQDDAEALADWEAWLRTIEPVDWVAPGSFDEEYRRYNVEAVRKQMRHAREISRSSDTDCRV